MTTEHRYFIGQQEPTICHANTGSFDATELHDMLRLSATDHPMARLIEFLKLDISGDSQTPTKANHDPSDYTIDKAASIQWMLYILAQRKVQVSVRGCMR
jgi:hypothetical protein